jgi:hypothetical protein
MSDPFAAAGELALEMAALRLRSRRVLLEAGKALAAEARGAGDEQGAFAMADAAHAAPCRMSRSWLKDLPLRVKSARHGNRLPRVPIRPARERAPR